VLRPVEVGGDFSAPTLVTLPDKSTVEFLGKMYQLRTNAICCRTIHRNFMKSCVRKKMFLENFVILPWHFLGRTEMKREIIFAYPAN
jgi:hypothetical protein